MTQGPLESVDHYFSPHGVPPAKQERRVIDISLAGRTVQVHTASGVFSKGRLDPGTAVLLRKAPPLEAPVTHVLDLGCGWGPIAMAMATHAPEATVWAVDVNELALDLTRANAQRLGLNNVRATTPDGVPAEILFDAIWSNPPIRVGRSVLDAMLRHWLPRLAPGAQAHLVVQRNLGSDSLIRWMGEHLPRDMPGVQVTKAGSAKGYRIVEITAGGEPGTGAS